MRLIIAFILVLLVSAGGLSAGGICFGQHRFLSDREFIDAVILDLMKGRGSYLAYRNDGNSRTRNFPAFPTRAKTSSTARIRIVAVLLALIPRATTGRNSHYSTTSWGTPRNS
jgi:hypothetical protein